MRLVLFRPLAWLLLLFTAGILLLPGQAADTSWVTNLSTWTTSSKPLAPSGLSGQFDGKSMVSLSWMDNASNETAQEIWVSKDARNYTRLMRIGSNITRYSYSISSTALGSNMYYAVRATNATGASAFSPTIKIALISMAIPTPIPSPDASVMAGEVLNAVNAFRTQNGLPPLRMDDRLNQAAQRHSNDMAAAKTMSHNCQDGTTMSQRITQSGYLWRSIAENVAYGQSTSQQVVQAWINSSGHRANMLKTTVKDAGIGYNNRYWTLDLAG